ncbi:MAG TPA: serine/threonine protein kinase [Candidatus Blautia pullicola]|uniref:Serine/threonine protein kinase n=1 Tax=Candidatus Blautia pullicola TaxID=2838498 RepID=A0A9D2JSY3_9FIRM|nr:serine/threonine protein kinase [Candidatus Blautia pullicola]
MLEIGSVVDGKYKILNKIGQGGMSIVYLAMNERANKQWAIKEVRKDGVKNFEVVKQGLVVETDLLKKLNHPNLPSIIDVIDGDGTFLIVMDYIEGRHLESVVKEYGAQNQEDVIDWAKQLCDVLSYLHSRKPPIIYRDMKPSNIMLKPDGKVMLIDFGTAREFKESSVADTTCLGTQGYAAPEQYGGHGQTDARTDIYCLGATLYHLLTGHNPSEPPYEMYPIRYWNPDLSSGLEEIIWKCTQKNPEDRYQNCGELLYALEHYNELDVEYKRKQNLKWRAFLCTTALTVVMGAGAAGFKFAENSVTDSTYEAYLQEAGNLATTAPQQCIQYYENAIALNPIEGEAYNQLLNFFLWQNNDTEGENSITSSGQAACVFSDTEEQEIRKVLGTGEGRNRSNEEYLKGNTEAYDKFAYELGIAYFYSYNGTGNKAASKKWLQIAADAQPTEELNETNIERAENLYKIAEYYDSLGVRNQAGDSMVSYSDYWLDLVRIVENDAQNGNNVNTLLAYKELVAQIVTNCSNFKSAGITQKQMENQLDTGEELLNSMDIVTGSANAEYEQEMKDNLLVNLASARNIVNSTFNTGNLGNNAQGGEGNAADTAAD